MTIPRHSARHALKREGVRFVVAGAANTALSYSIYWALLPWLPYAYAYTVSFMVTVLTGYALTSRWVFRVRWSWSRLAAYPVIHALNYGLGLAIIWLAVEVLRVDAIWAPLLATACSVPVSFVLSRWLLLTRGRNRD